MRLYSTSEGIARETNPGELELLECDYTDLGQLLVEGLSLSSLADAPVVRRAKTSEFTIYAPIPRPGSVYCIGANYEDHLAEVKTVLEMIGDPAEAEQTVKNLRVTPMFFTVPSSAVTGPFDEIILPEIAPEQVDYEIEVAVIVGTGGKTIPEAKVWSHIAGLTLANDVSARDIQNKAMRGTEFEFGHAKGLDTFKPMGPCLVSTDEFSMPIKMKIQTSVNGEVRQSADLSDLIHNIEKCVSYVSNFHTLYPGDVILTGSPAGVGFFQGKFLKAGDVVTMTAEGIGNLENKISI